MEENDLGSPWRNHILNDESEYRGKYMPIEDTPLINDGSEFGMEEKITAWVARDTYNGLSLYFEKPIKTDYFWNSGSEEYYFDNQKLFPQEEHL